MNIDKQKEIYRDQACSEALDQQTFDEDDLIERIRFWQSLTPEDRFNATAEIVRRVHIAKGGKQDDLRVNKSMTSLIRTK